MAHTHNDHADHADQADQGGPARDGEHAPPPAPSHEGSVVLDIGAGTGALVIHARPEHDGLEIHVSPTNGPQNRTHAAVRPRHLPDGTAHAAVITPLSKGLYTVWDGEAAHGLVTVLDGRVSEYRWA